MRNFKSYVKSSPNDAVPALRSSQDIASYIKDLSHEVSFLEKCAMNSLKTPDEFFGVYKLLLDKNTILSNVLVSSGLTKDLMSRNAEEVVARSVGKLQSRIESFLDTSVQELSEATGQMPTNFARLMHSIAQTLDYSDIQLYRLPSLETGSVYSVKLTGLKLKNTSKYDTYYLHLNKIKDGWTTSCGHSLYQLVHANQFLSSAPFKSIKSGFKNTLELLSSEGIHVSPAKFSLIPRKDIHETQSCLNEEQKLVF